MPISHDNIVLSLENVVAIQVSDIVFDATAGVYRRKIQFYDQPINTSIRPVIEIDVDAPTQAGVQLQTPQLSF